jgi:hypothetical protein
VKRLSLLLVLAICLASSTWSQDKSAKLKVRALLIDKDLNQKPVPKLAFTLTPFEGPAGKSVSGKTGFDGSGEMQLAPGKYRLVTPEPVEFQNKAYTWELDVVVSITLVQIRI